MPPDEPWYVSAFRADYLAVYPHRDLASARREVGWILAQGLGGRLLDLSCGFGRHTLALREAGISAVGVDLSRELLVRARELPGGEVLLGRLLRADARRLPLADASFESVVNLFSSFGYFGDEGDARVLGEIARVLLPGGRAVLDLMNPSRIRAGLVPESRTARDGIVLRERRWLEDDGGRVVKEVNLQLPDGGERSWREDVRLYETDELERLARPLGLGLQGVTGSFDNEAYGPGAERQILQLRKRGGGAG